METTDCLDGNPPAPAQSNGDQSDALIWPRHIKPGEKMLSRDEVRGRTGHSTGLMYELIKRKQHPPPVRISARRVAWPSSWIDAYLSHLTKCPVLADQA